MGVFRFKQFEVDQANCAMKINTDGVLLAVLATSNNPYAILDIGTGTGVIAMMLAQRFVGAQVHAVEIDEGAAITANRNFKNSQFANRLSVDHTAIESFDSQKGFDLIVSNPPYFVNDLKNPDVKKQLARHANQDFFSVLLDKVFQLLSPEGMFWFILPVKQADEMIERGFKLGLFVKEQIFVHSDESKPMIRKVVCLGKNSHAPKHSHFYIYQSDKQYTDNYRRLLKPFFIAY